MAFSILTRLCNHHLCLVSKHFHHFKRKPHTHSTVTLCSPSSFWPTPTCFLCLWTNIIMYEALWYFLFYSISVKNCSRPTKLISLPTNAVVHIGITWKALKATDAWALPQRFWSDLGISRSSQAMLSSDNHKARTNCPIYLWLGKHWNET